MLPFWMLPSTGYVVPIICEEALENTLVFSHIEGSEQTNKLHLFVKDNSQTQRFFLPQLARYAASALLVRVDLDDLIIFTIQASNALDDLLFLKVLFDEMVSK